MKEYFQPLGATLRNGLNYLERYFLGPGEVMPNRLLFNVKINGQPLKRAFLCQIGSDDNAAPLHIDLAAIPIAPVMVAVGPPFIEFEEIVCLRPKNNLMALRLNPPHIESMLPMIEEIFRHLTGPLIIILKSISQLPLRQDLMSYQVAYKPDYNEIVIAQMLKLLRYIINRQNSAVILVDYDATLGQKNSALLQRIFFRNTD